MWPQLLVLLGITIFNSSTTAQKPPPRLQLGVGACGVLYTGDLSGGDEWFHRPYPGANFSLQFHSPTRISPQLNVGFGRVVAQDREFSSAEVPGINNYARMRYVHADLVLRLVFCKLSRFRPHVGLGAGLLGFSVLDEQQRDLANRPETRLPNETYTNSLFYLPLCAGARFTVNDFASILVEYKQLNLASDYMDNIGEAGTASGNDRLRMFHLGVLLTPSLRYNRPRAYYP